MPSKPCGTCHKWLPIFSNQMCRHCYTAWGLKAGIPADRMPQRCPAEGCTDFVVKRGFCDRHYRRFLDHGTTEKLRTVSAARLHPEHKNWAHLQRIGKFCSEWADFWAYIEAVGERPSPRHWLDRPNKDLPYGPTNFEWRAPLLSNEFPSDTVEGRRDYQRAKRKVAPLNWTASGLKRFFGMTREQYDDLQASQDGGCAICGCKADVDAKGAPQLLAVDHNHLTGEIRGLLCRNHNIMMGLACDDPEILRRATEYLKHDKHTGLFVPEREERKSTGGPIGFVGSSRGKQCTVDGCDKAIKAQGLCTVHYARCKRTGSTELVRSTRPNCSVTGCGRIVLALGMCRKHYYRQYRTGSPEAAVILSPAQLCSVEGCGVGIAARGFCHTHYTRWKRRGSPDVVLDTHGRPIAQPPATPATSDLFCDAPPGPVN